MAKTFQAGDYEAIHENPVWREKANFIIAAYLGEKDGRQQWEQLWAAQLEAHRFRICCIPFFVYDLGLGDEVETDSNFVVERVVKSAGGYPFRVWFGESRDPKIRADVVQQIEDIGGLLEWSSRNLLAINIGSAEKAQMLADCLYAHQCAGNVVYETGRTGDAPADQEDSGDAH